MSLAFERTLAPPAGSTLLPIAILALAAAGAALAVAYCWQRWHWPVAAVVLAGCVAVLAAGARAIRRRVRPGEEAAGTVPVLCVDALGRAALRWRGQQFACTARHWLLADGWAALTLEIHDPSAPRGLRRLDVWTGGRDDDAWRRMRVWLTWLRRGGPPEGAFESVTEHRQPVEFPTSLASHRSP